jgi:hypothetical protein
MSEAVCAWFASRCCSSAAAQVSACASAFAVPAASRASGLGTWVDARSKGA